MSVIATAVKHLLAAGVTGDALVAAIAEMEANAAPTAVVDETAERRRAWDRQYRAEKRAAAKVSGGLGGSRVDTPDNADIAPSLDKSPQTPKINPTPRSGVCVAPTRKAGQFPVPQGCDPNDWRDLLANRKSKRLPMTAAAYRKLLRDLAEQSDDEWPPGRVLAHAAEKGWAAIFDPRPDQGNRRNGKRPHHNDRPRGRGLLGADLDAEHEDRARSSV